MLALPATAPPVPAAAAAPVVAAPTVAPVVVIGTTPLNAEGRERPPVAAASLDAADLERAGPASVLRALDTRLAGVALDQAQANPFQPSLIYRGFEASPLAGDAQGLAVYLGGLRFNQPFGDTVNWDLIPDAAVSRIELVGANPAFGLNALGGALSIRLKDGFSAPGARVEVSGGSFGRRQATGQVGGTVGAFGAYAAVSGMDDDGWRDFSPSRLRQGYADVGWRGETTELHLSAIGADNDLTGNGPAPAALLAVDRSAVFTHPDQTRNRFGRAALSVAFRPGGGWSAHGAAYFGAFRQATANGDAAEVEPCAGAPGLLCFQDEDTPLTDTAGAAVANFVTGSPYAMVFPRYGAGGPYALLNRTRTLTHSYGVAGELAREGTLMGRHNRVVAGASFDGARTQFTASSLLGGLSLDRGWFGPGVELDLEDGAVQPVAVRSTNRNLGLYASDVWDLTGALSLTVSGRFDATRIALHDRLGTALDGSHTFARFNPAAGLTWRLAEAVSAYAGYAQTSRAPTPAEFSCADALAPCSLSNFFVADPPLRQVTAGSFEGGLRGGQRLGAGRLDWRAGLYRIDARHDIQLVASAITGRGYFVNVGGTRRQGMEAGLTFATRSVTVFADYALTEATYRTGFVLSAGANPAFDDESDPMVVAPGDQRPGVPRHNLKIGADWRPTPALTLGFDAQATSGRRFQGDEANLNPKTAGYALANLHGSYRVNRRLELFGELTNLFDAHVTTFGAYAPVDSVPILEGPTLDDPASLSPGPPRAGYVGLRLTF